MSENKKGVIKVINDLAERFEERFDALKEDVDMLKHHDQEQSSRSSQLRSPHRVATSLQERSSQPSQSRSRILALPLPPVGIASRAEEPREAGSHQLTTTPGQTGWRRRRRTTACAMTRTRKWTGRGADQIWWRCPKRHTNS